MSPETGGTSDVGDEAKRQTLKWILGGLTLASAGAVGALSAANERGQLEIDAGLLHLIENQGLQIEGLVEADKDAIQAIATLLKRIVALEERVAQLESGQLPQPEPPIPFGNPPGEQEI